ncbi:hypothetical protein [Epilithonimonas tenax]|uniref:hypothetical protein n=1 Tax=Epilithonimonas tenax TaxID=191577 RepID=UPI0004141432|nr:hypothetical protein [Epilithonimonas tenax]
MKKIYTLGFIALIFSAKSQVGIYKESTGNFSTPKITLAIGDDDTGIQWNSVNNISLTTNNSPRITIDANANVGINQTNPNYKLDIDASNDALRMMNLKDQSANTFTQFLAIDKITGEIGVKTNPSSLGQFLRLPIVDEVYNAGSTTTLNFSAAREPAPNNSENYINTISGILVNDVANTVTLQEGVYSINLKIVGIFKGLNDNNQVNVRFTVNGNLYDYQPGIIYGYAGENADSFNNGEANDSRKTGYFQETLIVPASGATISFALDAINNNFHLYQSFIPSGSTGNSSRTVLTINRLK